MSSEAAARLILEHTRPPVVALLRELGFQQQADDLANAPSLSALRHVAAGIPAPLRAHIRFGPLRRSASSAVGALHGAALLGLRGDVDNAAIVALGAWTHVARARAWHRRWWQLLRWKTVRARLLQQARAEQIAYLQPPDDQ